MVYKTPLKWPATTPRTTDRRDARFGAKASSGIGYRSLSVPQALDRLAGELRRLGVQDFENQVLVMTAMKPAFSGSTIPDQAQPKDPGAVVHWEISGKERTMAIDIYNRTADNIAAIAAVLEYLRGVERHGGHAVQEQAFAGFDALPAPDSCWMILGMDQGVLRSKENVMKFFRDRAAEPNDHRGLARDMAALVAARDDALAKIRGEK